MWANDSRRGSGPGRYEHRVIGTGLSMGIGNVVIPANPARVSLILSARFAAPTFGDGLIVGPVVGTSVIPVAILTPENACVTVSFCGAGDMIWRAMASEAMGAGAAVFEAYEVVFHPDKV